MLGHAKRLHIQTEGAALSVFCYQSNILHTCIKFSLGLFSFFFSFFRLGLSMKHVVHNFIETERNGWEFWIKRLSRTLFVSWCPGTYHPRLAHCSVLHFSVLKDFKVRKGYFAHLVSPCGYYRPEHVFCILSRPRSTTSFLRNESQATRKLVGSP